MPAALILCSETRPAKTQCGNTEEAGQTLLMLQKCRQKGHLVLKAHQQKMTKD